MKYAIYGAGSLGLVTAAYLARANENFDIIDRNVKSVEAINTNGISIVGTTNMHETAHAILETEVKEKYDIIFLFSKQIDNIKTIQKVAKFLANDGVICTMQNGLPERDVQSVIGEDRTYGAAVGWGATRLDYGISRLTSTASRDSMTFSLGSLSNHTDSHLTEIERILGIVGSVTLEHNFIGARYVKLIINSAFSAMSTVCGDTFGGVAKNKKSRKVIQLIIKECIEVAKTLNITIEPIQGHDVVKLLDYNSGFKKWLSFKIIPIAIKKHAALKASMLQDIEKGHPCEIDSINKIICDMGKEAKIATPANEMVVRIIKQMEKGPLKPSYDNIEYFSGLIK